VSSPARPGAELRPLWHFLHIFGHTTLLAARKIRFSCPKYKEKVAATVTTAFKSGDEVTIVTYKVAPMVDSTPCDKMMPGAAKGMSG